MSNKDKQKEVRERDNFLRFLRAAGWSVVEEEIESRKPPEPDILYRCNGKIAAFEMLSVTQSEFMQPLENAQVIYPGPTTLKDNLRKKLGTNYNSQYPVELIIYCHISMATNDSNLMDMQDVLWNADQIPFQRIWYFGENDRLFLFHKNWWSEILGPSAVAFLGGEAD